MINSKNVSLILASIGFLVLSITGAAVGGGGPCLTTCLGQNLTFDRLSAANVTCHAEMKDVIKLSPNPTPKELKKVWKNDCFMACMWEKLGVVTNGAVSTPGVTSYITSTFPATVRSTITDGISDCTKVSGTGLVKTDECKSYKPLTKCFLKVVKTACRAPAGTMAQPSGSSVPSGRRRRRQAPAPPASPSSSEESDEN